MMSSPTAYHEPDAILAALGTRPEKMRSVAHFFDNHMEGAGSVDFTSSLIILPETDGWRFGAHLCLAPNIEQLPMIFRTGDGSPQMDGRPLHLTTNHITDPHLQRMGSLHFCRTALAEDLAGLVAKLRVRVAQAVKAKPDWKIDTNNDTSIIRNMLHDMEIRYDKTNVREVVRSLERLLLCADDSFKHEFQRFISEYCGGLTASDVEKLASPADSSEFLLYDLLAAAISSVLLRKWRHFFNDELIACEKNSVNLVIQGAGDLSMNSWNVAFYRDKNRLPRMVAPESGPNFRGRKYHCLVAWKAGRPIAEIANYVKKYQLGTTLGRSLSIARLQFPAGSTSLQFEDRDGSRAEEPASLHESVEFALYGKPVLWNGEVIKPEKFVADEALVEQFQDLRHVFNLPNLNNDPSFGRLNTCRRS